MNDYRNGDPQVDDYRNRLPKWMLFLPLVVVLIVLGAIYLVVR